MQHQAAVCQLTHARMAGNGCFLHSAGSVFGAFVPHSGGIGAADRLPSLSTSPRSRRSSRARLRSVPSVIHSLDTPLTASGAAVAGAPRTAGRRR